MDGFISFIFLLLLAVWLFGIVARWLFRRWVRRKVGQFEQAARNASQSPHNANRPKQEGEVIIEPNRQAFEKRVNKNVGDYVEFEEVTETDKNQGEA